MREKIPNRGLNPEPPAYGAGALPLSYSGELRGAAPCRRVAPPLHTGRGKDRDGIRTHGGITPAELQSAAFAARPPDRSSAER
jgi:hypothetical protein